MNKRTLPDIRQRVHSMLTRWNRNATIHLSANADRSASIYTPVRFPIQRRGDSFVLDPGDRG